MTQLQDYLLTTNIPANSPFVLAGFIGAGVLCLITVVLRLMHPTLKRRYRAYKKYAEVIASVLPVFRIAALLWLLFFFLRYQDLSPFDRRIWVYALWLPTLVICLILARRKSQTVPIAQREDVLETRFKQYLPKQK